MSGSTGAPGGTTYRGAVDRPFTRAMRADGRPATLDDYVAAGGYEGLRRALDDLEAPEVTTMVTESGLRGRGGAGYSTGRKWSTMPLGPDAPHPKYIVCNGDEMEPGSFKDRFLMERNPHLLIEGMLLAGFATEADAGYIFVRAQYDASLAALGRAIGEARERGYLGERVLGSRFSFDIELHESIGRYICGEASAMLNALESQRPNPRARPPHMTGAGLFSRPTVVNNVETYMAVPSIVAHGPDWWKGLSVTDEGGTKICGVAGRVARPGCYELPMGTPIRQLIEVHAGGMLPGYALRAVSPGGASTAFVAAADLDVPLGFSTMGAVQQPPRDRHDGGARRPDLPGRHDAQHDAVLRPGVVRLVHALPRGAAVGRDAARRHRARPRPPRRPGRPRGAGLVHGLGQVLLRPGAGRDAAARGRAAAVPRRLRAPHR